MRRTCEKNGAAVRTSGIVNWAKSRRESTMAKAVERLSRAF
jgi:hypothetical protein